MKLLVLSIVLLSTVPALAQDRYFHVRDQHNMAEVSKRDAMLILLNDKDQTVVKCVPQEVTDKVTMKNKRKQK